MNANSESIARLTDREELILQATVQSYITTAEPVGSRAIVKRFALDLSPATVRNVMADLEEAGYLQQRHTSSGRVPTDLGYRYYVNHLMRVQELTMSERARIEQEFSQRLNDADTVMQRTSQLLALVSHHAGIVEAPGESSAAVSRIELMPMGGNRLAVLIADSFGRVHTVVVEQDAPAPELELSRISRFLNENFRGVAINKLSRTLESRIREYMDEQRRLAERALGLLGLMPAERPAQLFLEGASSLFEHPEFHNLEKAREVFHLLEERERLAGLLRSKLLDDDEPRTMIIFGSEAQPSGLEEISVVSAPYRVGDKTVGMIGVLGPRRMPYSKLTAVVDYTANMLGRFLTKLAG